MTGRDATRTSPPNSATTGSTRTCRPNPPRRWTTSAVRCTAGPPGSTPSTRPNSTRNSAWTRRSWPAASRCASSSSTNCVRTPGIRCSPTPAARSTYCWRGISHRCRTGWPVSRDGTVKLIAGSASTTQIDQVRPAALDALAEHRDWLSAQLTDADDSVSPRIGAERFARKLSLTLSAAADSDAILDRARADLDRITEEITELAAQFGGTPREVLRRLAQDAPDDTTILGLCGDALAAQTAFVRDARIVTVHDDPFEIIEMPEIDRGVAVAYCDPPGLLESAPLPTMLAVSPTPADWTAERVASFYREYNKHMVHNLMVHEAMPGHYLQLGHASRFTASGTAIRAALWSGSFVEGWAVYAEEVMAANGYPGEGDPRSVRMQQLKMQLRTTINAILDAGVHAHGMTEAEAMALMMERGYQEEGEAAGKWRRAQLTSAQLSTYYVGYTEVADLARELRAARPGIGQLELHDAMLAHGSPPARLLR